MGEEIGSHLSYSQGVSVLSQDVHKFLSRDGSTSELVSAFCSGMPYSSFRGFAHTHGLASAGCFKNPPSSLNPLTPMCLTKIWCILGGIFLYNLYVSLAFIFWFIVTENNSLILFNLFDLESKESKVKCFWQIQSTCRATWKKILSAGEIAWR